MDFDSGQFKRSFIFIFIEAKKSSVTMMEEKLNPTPNIQEQIINQPVSASEKRHNTYDEYEAGLAVPSENKDIGTASIPSSVFNLCNTVIGAGILGFPSAIANTGYIPAIILFVFVAIVTSFSLHLNMISGQSLRPKASYKALCESTIPKLKMVVDATIALTTFGVLCAYLIVIGDSLPPGLFFPDYLKNTEHTVQILNIFSGRTICSASILGWIIKQKSMDNYILCHIYIDIYIFT